MTARPCACHSGLRYAECCGPMHAGLCEAAHPAVLMRSRFAAFALGLGGYLLATLSEDHPDRQEEPEALVRALSRAKDTQRFLGLTIESANAHDGRGEVTFEARIFERGKDHSFRECSQFHLERGGEARSGGWRYASGTIL